jgi:hypothetical protein
MRKLLFVVIVLLAARSAHAFCFGTAHVHVVDANSGLGRAGVTVQLDQNADGTIEDTKITDANGDANFFAPAVVPYRVLVVTPTGTVASPHDHVDTLLICNGTTSIAFAIAPALPALSAGTLILLALSLAGVALVVLRGGR